MTNKIFSRESLFHLIAFLLAAFFIYKGMTKHLISPCRIYSPESTIPKDYIMVMDIFCKSGFFIIIGCLQVLSGLLLIFPKTRFAGILILMPIVVNIFTIHLVLDNRPEELVETGIPLTLCLILVLRYLRRVF
jgi:putative oxidoreductase